jgi:rhodanese-related sulfurtransferase
MVARLACVVITVLVAVGFVPSALLGQDRTRVAEPLCGVYSLYIASGLEGREADLDKLLSAVPVDRKDGSSMLALVQAAESLGLHAIAYAGLALPDLRAAKCPLILHVSRRPGVAKYNHYVVLAAGGREKAVLIDGADGRREVDWGYIATIWDGKAVAVSADAAAIQELGSHSRAIAFGAIASGAFVAIVALVWQGRWCAANRPEYSRSWQAAQALRILVAAAVSGCVYHALVPSGMFRATGAVAAVQRMYPGLILRHLSIAEAEAAMATGNAVLVDARSRAAFNAGHIDGAINIPAMLEYGARQHLVNDMPRDMRIIIYCEGAQCSFAEIDAQDFMEAGFENVQLFPGGWAEWSRASRT